MSDVLLLIENPQSLVDDKPASAWLAMPTTHDELREKLGDFADESQLLVVNDENRLSIRAGESLLAATRKFEAFSQIEGTPLGDNAVELMLEWFDDIFGLVEAASQIKFYDDEEEMADRARHKILDNYPCFPSDLIEFVDLRAMGWELANNGKFLITDNGIFEYTA